MWRKIEGSFRKECNVREIIFQNSRTKRSSWRNVLLRTIFTKSSINRFHKKFMYLNVSIIIQCSTIETKTAFWNIFFISPLVRKNVEFSGFIISTCCVAKMQITKKIAKIINTRKKTKKWLKNRSCLSCQGEKWIYLMH